MADNPVSWLILTIVCLYFICRLFWRIIQEDTQIKQEREKACQEIFLENPVDRANAMCYNKYINTKGVNKK